MDITTPPPYKAHLTAIKRPANSLSKPMEVLYYGKCIRRPALDHGCGHGQDADALRITGWDPYHRNWLKTNKHKYDTVTSIYVLNVLPKKYEDEILEDIYRHLNKNGSGYIAVRRHLKKLGITKRGTYQREVELKLPSHYKCYNFEIYRMIR